MIKRCGHILTQFLLDNEVIKKNEQDIYEYGFQVFLVNALQILLIFFLGILVHHIIDTILFVMLFTTLRSFCGGYHSKTMFRCTIVTVSMWTIAIATVSSVELSMAWKISFLFLGGVLTLLTMVLYAPVDNVNKPLSLQGIKINRKRSMVSLAMWLIATCIFMMINIHYAEFIIFVLTEISMLIIWEKIRSKTDMSITRIS